MLIVPVVDDAAMPTPAVEVRLTSVVIVVVPVVADVLMTLPLTLPTVPPVSETITLPLPFVEADTARVVPLSAPPVWLSRIAAAALTALMPIVPAAMVPAV